MTFYIFTDTQTQTTLPVLILRRDRHHDTQNAILTALQDYYNTPITILTIGNNLLTNGDVLRIATDNHAYTLEIKKVILY